MNDDTIQHLPENEILIFTEAIGWIELHAPEEALRTVREISPSYQKHFAVLRLKWIILHQLKRFDECKTAGDSLISLYPDQLDSWMLYAQSFYIVKDYHQALLTLKTVEKTFATNWHFAYDYACYHSLTNDFDGTKRWLALAKEHGDPKKIEKMFKNDSDFAPYRQFLRSQEEPPKS